MFSSLEYCLEYFPSDSSDRIVEIVFEIDLNLLSPKQEQKINVLTIQNFYKHVYETIFSKLK